MPGNLLSHDGTIVGVIDWAASGVGDPACDLMIAWAMPSDARRALRAELDVDDSTWERGRGWTLQQAVAFIPYYATTIPAGVIAARQRLAAVLEET